MWCTGYLSTRLLPHQPASLLPSIAAARFPFIPAILVGLSVGPLLSCLAGRLVPSCARVGLVSSVITLLLFLPPWLLPPPFPWTDSTCYCCCYPLPLLLPSLSVSFFILPFSIPIAAYRTVSLTRSLFGCCCCCCCCCFFFFVVVAVVGVVGIGRDSKYDVGASLQSTSSKWPSHDAPTPPGGCRKEHIVEGNRRAMADLQFSSRQTRTKTKGKKLGLLGAQLTDPERLLVHIWKKRRRVTLWFIFEAGRRWPRRGIRNGIAARYSRVTRVPSL